MYQSSMYKKEFKDVFLNIKVLKKFTYKKPLIIDVGSNEGQSITKFKKKFFQPKIHAFEPLKDCYKNLNKKFKNGSNILLNNYALGDRKCKSDLISFYKLNEKSKFHIKKYK